MANNENASTTSAEIFPVFSVDVRVKGHLGPEWRSWFDGLTITLDDDGTTTLTGTVKDQSAVFGLFKKVHNLGLPLCSLTCVAGQPDDLFQGMDDDK